MASAAARATRLRYRARTSGTVAGTGHLESSPRHFRDRDAATARSPERWRMAGLCAILAVTALLLIGCKGGIASANVPPTGEVWFGQSFDTTTFAISGRTSSVKVGAPFAAVANVGKTVEGSQMNMRVYLDGTLVGTTGLSWTGSGDVWGWSPNPAYAAGSWRYELTDVGGNVLAGGQVEATD